MKRIVTAVALGAIAAIAWVGAPADAGVANPTAGLNVDIRVTGIDAETVADGLTFELFTDPGGADGAPTYCADRPVFRPIFDEAPLGQSRLFLECIEVPEGDYVLGLDGLPDGFAADVDCFGFQPNEALDDPAASITLFPGDDASCDIEVYDPTKLHANISSFSIDTEPFASFALEAFPEGLGGFGDNVIDPATCSSTDPELINVEGSFLRAFIECDLAPESGSFALGLDGMPPSYESFAFCFDERDGPFEQIEDGFPFFFFPSEFGPTVCDIRLSDPTRIVARVRTSSFDPTVLAGLTLEAFVDTEPIGDNAIDPSTCVQVETAFFFGDPLLLIECDLAPGEYLLGLDGLSPKVTETSSFCFGGGLEPEVLDRGDDPVAFFKSEFSSVTCDVRLVVPPDVMFDIVVDGGPHLADPVVELFDSEGVLLESIADPAEAQCSTEPPAGEEGPAAISYDDCAVTAQPGDSDLGTDYSIGLADLPNGYVFAGAVECESFYADFDEILPEGAGDFTHGQFNQDTLCTIPLRYVEQTVTADITVVNDDGDGASDGSDFVIEVFDGGALVDSGADPAPNDDTQSAEFVLPIGDYQFGVSGPAGYDVTIEVTVVDLASDVFADGSGDFGLTESQTVSADLTADDIATTTTTTVPPTTQPPTTVPPTTDDGGSGAAVPTTTTTTTLAPILPATGSSSSVSLGLVLAALALVLAGGGAIQLARRRS